MFLVKNIFDETFKNQRCVEMQGGFPIENKHNKDILFYRIDKI